MIVSASDSTECLLTVLRHWMTLSATRFSRMSRAWHDAAPYTRLRVIAQRRSKSARCWRVAVSTKRQSHILTARVQCKLRSDLMRMRGCRTVPVSLG